MRGGIVVQEVDHDGRRRDEVLHVGVLAVQYPQGIRPEPAQAVLVQALAVLVEISDQLVTVARPRVRVAERVYLERQALEPELSPHAGTQEDQLGIDVRPLVAQRLDVDLVKLAVTSFLRLLVAEHGTRGPELLPLVVQEPVRYPCAHHARGGFRPQRQALAVAVLEGIHLLLDDVGHLADRTAEELGVLDDRQADLAVAVVLDEVAHGVLEIAPGGGILREHVVHAAYGFRFHVCLGSLGCRARAPGRRRRRSGLSGRSSAARCRPGAATRVWRRARR